MTTSDIGDIAGFVYMKPLESGITKCGSGYAQQGGRPRKKAENKVVQIHPTLTPEQAAWLAQWFPTGTPNEQFRELLERAMKFWPDGPNKNGATRPGARKPRRTPRPALERRIAEAEVEITDLRTRVAELEARR